MKDQSSTTSEKTALQLIGHVLDGPMTVATYMECLHLLGDLLRSSARTTGETTSRDGSENLPSKSKTQEEKSAQLFTRKLERLRRENSTQPSRCQCLCRYCMKQGIHNYERRNDNAKHRY